MRLPEGKKPELEFDPDDFYATDAFNDYAVEFLKQAQEKDEPFFLYLAHSSPHFPLHAPAKTRDAYLDTYRKGWDLLRKERFARQRSSGLVTDSWKFTDSPRFRSTATTLRMILPVKRIPIGKALIKNGRRIWFTGWRPSPP